MLIAPPFEPPRRVTSLRGARPWFVAMLLVLAGGCLFELPPLEQGLGGGSGSSGFAGTPPFGGGSGGQGGSIGPGGSAGSQNPACPPDQKLCGESCRPKTAEFGCATTSCQPCGSAANANIDCNGDGECAVLGCQPGFVDCNGDTLNQVPPLTGDGCEYPLGPTAATTPTLDVPFANIQVDGGRDDWNGLPSYAFEQLCNNCIDNQTVDISAASSAPPREDLDGRFRVAWDGDKFYVLVEAFDNQLYATGTAGGKCQHDAECEDAAQVFFSGRNRRDGYFEDNQRVFLGLSTKFGAPSQGQPAVGDVEISVGRTGNFCYRIEAQVDWRYITTTKNNANAAPGHFPPAVGQSYGFDIALNDWDAPISDENAIQRQSQVFWLDPGLNYQMTTVEIGTMILRDSADAGQ